MACNGKKEPPKPDFQKELMITETKECFTAVLRSTNKGDVIIGISPIRLECKMDTTYIPVKRYVREKSPNNCRAFINKFMNQLGSPFEIDLGPTPCPPK